MHSARGHNQGTSWLVLDFRIEEKNILKKKPTILSALYRPNVLRAPVLSAKTTSRYEIGPRANDYYIGMRRTYNTFL